MLQKRLSLFWQAQHLVPQGVGKQGAVQVVGEQAVYMPAQQVVRAEEGRQLVEGRGGGVAGAEVQLEAEEGPQLQEGSLLLQAVQGKAAKVKAVHWQVAAGQQAVLGQGGGLQQLPWM
jgi:hypothetical protein